MNRKIKKIIKWTFIVFITIFVLLLIALKIYSTTSYEPLDEMYNQLDLIQDDSIERYDDFDEIRYTVDNPIKNIIFVTGGLVEPESYEYLAYNLALNGYNVTITKPLFNLAILTPNYASRFIDEDLDNVIIGHSLGGVVGSMVANKNSEISTVILMGSYPINDVSDKDVLIISAEYDEGMDPDAFEASFKYLNEEAEFYHIEEGNHAQFGWYGPQKGDGEATISTLEQQTIVVNQIIDYLNQ